MSVVIALVPESIIQIETPACFSENGNAVRYRHIKAESDGNMKCASLGTGYARSGHVNDIALVSKYVGNGPTKAGKDVGQYSALRQRSQVDDELRLKQQQVLCQELVLTAPDQSFTIRRIEIGEQKHEPEMQPLLQYWERSQ